MAEYDEHSQAQIGVHVEASAVYTEATFRRIVEDALFFRRAAEHVNSDSDRKRYARTIILLMALYLESLSNRIFLHFFDPVTLDEKKRPNRCLNNVDGRSDLPGPIRNFRAAYKECLNRELTLDTNGIRDIFTIRNRIIAHPSGRAQLQTDKDRFSPVTISVKWLDNKVSIVEERPGYRKFKHFHSVYSHFTLREADEILEEVKEFLTNFLGSLKGKVPQEQFDEWWPAELVKWSKPVSTY